MLPLQKSALEIDVTGPHDGLSARGRLTARLLEIAEHVPDGPLTLAAIRETLDDVLVQDCRFPFHLAAFLKGRMGASRVAIALLVEASNRVGLLRRRQGQDAVLPFALRPIVLRVVENSGEAAYAMAYQVRHHGWAMPTPLRASLNEVLQRCAVRVDAPCAMASASSSRRVQPVLASA